MPTEKTEPKTQAASATETTTSVRIFVTGGTFDKEYDEINGRLYFKDSHISEMLKLGRCQLTVDIRTLMMIDSLDMTDADRSIILNAARSATEKHILITHGTDTMETTARLLGLEGLDKTIVVTGAMIPYAFGSSDGLFNLGAAMAFAQCLPSGVYVAMNGRYFTWDNVEKDRRTGFFMEKLK